jgi:riboflavin kinase / FMN adenylyltransferase
MCQRSRRLTIGPGTRQGQGMAWLCTHPDILPTMPRPVVAIGNFDGVHAGHRALLAVAKEVALGLGKAPVVVLTFDPHPRLVLRPEVPHYNLMTLPEKQAALGVAGVQGVAVVPFTLAVAQQTPEAFVAEIVQGWLQAQAVVVGENFRFGAKAAGTPAMLAAMLGAANVQVVALLRDAEGPLSSTRLRVAQTAGKTQSSSV